MLKKDEKIIKRDIVYWATFESMFFSKRLCKNLNYAIIRSEYMCVINESIRISHCLHYYDVTVSEGHACAW